MYDGGRVGYEGCRPDGARQERDHTAPPRTTVYSSTQTYHRTPPPARAQAPNPHYCGKQRQREQRAARQSVEVRAEGACAAASCLAWARWGCVGALCCRWRGHVYSMYAGRNMLREHAWGTAVRGRARACTLSRGVVASNASKITTTGRDGEVRGGRSGPRFGPAFRVK